MNNDVSSRYLWAAVALIVLLGGLFTWSTIYRRINTFEVGTAPTKNTPIAQDPTLPPVRPTDPRIGSTRPDATEIVEYADYRCQHCRLMAPDLFALLNDSRKNVRLIWREAPTLDQTREGLLPFAAARCAHAQGKFANMDKALFEATTLNESTILGLARAQSLNMTLFQTCLNDPNLLTAIRADQTTALSYNITAAPTLFVHGQAYVGSLSTAELQSLVP